jgi:probable HAF family extracellular repeat protein
MNSSTSTPMPATARSRLTPVFTALGLLAGGGVAAGPLYTCHRLDATNPYDSQASAINDRSVVLGKNVDGAVKWGKKWTQQLSRYPNTAQVYPSDINHDGIVVGSVTVGGFPLRSVAVRWGADGSPVALPQSTADHAYANGINNLGEIAGQLDFGPYTEAGVWSTAGVWRALPAPAGTVYPSAIAINDKGTVIGVASTISGSDARAVRWKDGQARLLERLPGQGPTWPSAINEAGQIVGHSNWNAVTWLRGKVHALPGDGATGSNAVSVNSRGEIVGFLSWWTPVYWPSRTAAPMAVADLLGDGSCTGPAGEEAKVTQLAAINNRGVIAATGEWKNSSGFTVQGAFRLQPVEAP